MVGLQVTLPRRVASGYQNFGGNYYIQGVPGGMCQTSGECSLGQTIPI